MKIAIVNDCVPFIYGGAELLVDNLKTKLIENGHKVVLIQIPFYSHPPSKILEQIVACRLLSLEDIDKVIAFKFPSYYIKHPNKVLWLIHQFRQVYDLWGTPYQSIPETNSGLKIKNFIIESDNVFLKEPKKIYTNSKIVSSRLKQYNNIASEVLYPPLLDPKRYFFREYGNFIFYPSRITKIKRQFLAIESMRYVKTNVKLIIAGNPDSGEELILIKKLVEKYNLKDKVKIIAKWISEREKINLFADALASLYIPYNEDSYGFVSLESYYSKKPVITCNDSGGTLELVEDGINGYITFPGPRELAEIMDKMYSNKKITKKLGVAGYGKLISMDISWDNVIKKLLNK